MLPGLLALSLRLSAVGGGMAIFLSDTALTLAALSLLLPLSVRCLHDSGRSGRWLLPTLLPFVGFVIGIVLVSLPSQPRARRSGPPRSETLGDAESMA